MQMSHRMAHGIKYRPHNGLQRKRRHRELPAQSHLVSCGRAGGSSTRNATSIYFFFLFIVVVACESVPEKADEKDYPIWLLWFWCGVVAIVSIFFGGVTVLLAYSSIVEVGCFCCFAGRIVIPIELWRAAYSNHQLENSILGSMLYEVLAIELVVGAATVPILSILGAFFSSCEEGTPSWLSVGVGIVLSSRSKIIEVCLLRLYCGGFKVRKAVKLVLGILETMDKMTDAFTLPVLFACDALIHPRFVASFEESNYVAMRAFAPIANCLHVWGAACACLVVGTLWQALLPLVLLDGKQAFSNVKQGCFDLECPELSLDEGEFDVRGAAITSADMSGWAAFAACVAETSPALTASITSSFASFLRVFMESMGQGLLQMTFLDLLGESLSARIFVLTSVCLSALVTIMKGAQLFYGSSMVFHMSTLEEVDMRDDERPLMKAAAILGMVAAAGICSTGIYIAVKLWNHEQCVKNGHSAWGFGTGCMDFSDN